MTSGGSEGKNGSQHRTANGRRPSLTWGDQKKSNGDRLATAVEDRHRHNTEDSEISVQSMEKYIPTPPDGGWGWVIVACSFVSNLIVDGIGYTFGVFLMEFVEVFDESKSKVSLVGSLLCGVYLFAGPLVSAMTNKWGCRNVVVTGSCIATLAFVCATFAPNIDILIITYGVMGGFGLGMIYLPAIVSVGYYFEKKRAFATGLAVSGSGVGTFIFPPLSEFLLGKYAWRGGLLIIAGIIAQGCICGALMRPLEAKPVKKTKPSVKGETQRESVAFLKRDNSAGGGSELRRQSGEGGGGDGPRQVRNSESRSHKLSVGSSSHAAGSVVGSPDRDPSRLAGSPPSAGSPLSAGSPGPNTPAIVVSDKTPLTSPDSEEDYKLADMDSLTDGTSPEYYTPAETALNSPVKGPSDTDEERKKDSIDATTTVQNGYTTSMNNFHTEITSLLEVPSPRTHKGSPSGTSGWGGSRTNMLHINSAHSLHVSKKDLARPMYRKDIFYSGSVANLPQFTSQPDMKNYITSITTIPGEMDFVESPSKSSKFVNVCCSCLPRPARDTLSEMVDLSLLKDVSFMLICLGNFTAFLGFYIPFVFVVDYSVSLGVDKNAAAFLISIIGITNTIGRIVTGKVADLKIVDSLVITYLAIVVCGLTTAIIPFCDSYALLATVAALFGLAVAAFISLSSIVICDRLGLEKLTNGFGLLSMVRGVAGMVGPPFAGFLFDSSGTYNLSFYLGGLLLFAGAGCHMFLHLPCLRKQTLPTQILTVTEQDDNLQGMGSRPQIVSVEEAMSAV